MEKRKTFVFVIIRFYWYRVRGGGFARRAETIKKSVWQSTGPSNGPGLEHGPLARPFLRPICGRRTFAPGAWHAVAQDAPEEQRAGVQVGGAPGSGHGTSAQFAAFLLGHAHGQQVFAQAVLAHRSPAHAACNGTKSKYNGKSTPL